MRKYFVVPSVELEPQVYMKVTSNWVELTMRYVVDPKKRRQVTNYIWEKAFKRLQGREDITIASQISNVAIHWQSGNESSSNQARTHNSDHGRSFTE